MMKDENLYKTKTHSSAKVKEKRKERIKSIFVTQHFKEVHHVRFFYSTECQTTINPNPSQIAIISMKR